ncbi:MAG: pilus assembly protein TadG-related protein [Vicinamibacterales bacterium]
MMRLRLRARGPRRSSERGAVLVQTAVAMIGLIGFSSFVVDYGVLWTARRQAQNAADAAAMAAAAAYGFGGGDEARARAAAIEAARANLVWGEPPDVTDADVTFTTSCPAGSPEAGGGRCVRVDVFRNQARGNPLPTILGGIVGVTAQGARATATAEVLYANRTSCVRPLAVLDRWVEAQSPPWDPDDVFERYEPGLPGTLVGNPDSYAPPMPGNNGTGLDLALDYGQQLRLARRQNGMPDSANWFFPIQLDCPGNPPGSIECFMSNVTNCSPQAVGTGDVLQAHAGGFVGIDGVNYLIPALASVVDADAGAFWDGSANGGRGGVAGGCVSGGTCAVSPRILALPIVDPDVWGQQSAVDPDLHPTVNVTRVVGLFLEQANGTEIIGRVMPYPTLPSTTDLGVPGSAFVVSTLLVR